MIPQSLPKNLNDRLTLAYVAHREVETGEAQVSVRTLQRLLRFRSHETGTSVFRRCLDGGWLRLVEPARGPRANVYTLGPAAVGDVDCWRAIGAFYFDRQSGAMSKWLTSPWMLRKGLGESRCLIVALLNRQPGATVAEIASSSRGFVSRKSVESGLRKLRQAGIVERDESGKAYRYSLRADEDWFEAKSAALRLTDIAAGDDRRIEQERARRDTHTYLGRDLLRQRIKLRDCSYCGLSARADDAIEIEHVPPKNWGGGACTGFEIPAHRRCHAKHKILIENHRFDPAPSDFRFNVGSEAWDLDDDELVELLVEEAAVKVLFYQAAMNSLNLNLGVRAARDLAELGSAVASAAGVVKAVNVDTGEIRSLRVDRYGFQDALAVAAAQHARMARLILGEPRVGNLENSAQETPDRLVIFTAAGI